MRARAILLVAVVLAAVAAGGASAAPFAPRVSLDVHGDVTMAANTVLTCPAADPACAAAQAGGAGQNNGFAMTRVDADGDPTTFDSSRATLDLPAGAIVRFAGLYWGARLDGGPGGGPAPDPSSANRVRLAAPGSAYVAVAGATTGTGTVAGGAGYQAFADVTALVGAGGAGSYSVANVQAGTGRGAWGGWALVVAYEDPGLPLRNLTVSDGYQPVIAGRPPVTVPITGITAPAGGTVSARVGVVAYEGDRGYTGDAVRLDGVLLSGALNPANDFMRGEISLLGVDPGRRAPDYANQLGLDASVVDAAGVLPNGATGATVSLATTGDDYALGVLTTAIDLNAPDVRLATTATDLNGGALLPGDEIEYRVTAVNRGGDGAVGVALSAAVPAAADADAPLAAQAGDLAPGASAVVALRVRVAPTAAPGTTITFRPGAAYTGRTLGTPFRSVGDPVALVVAAPPAAAGLAAAPGPATPPSTELTLSVRGPPRARGGAALIYVVRLANAGPRPALGVELRVGLPEGLRPFAAAGGMELAERSLLARMPGLASGAARTFRIRLGANRLASGVQRVTVAVRALNAAPAAADVRSRVTPGRPCPALPG